MRIAKTISMVATAALLVVATGCKQPDADTATTTPVDSTAHQFTGDFQGPLGVQLWSVRDTIAKDLRGTLKSLHDMGFREVETAGMYGLTPQAFRQVLDSAGIAVSAMHVDWRRLRDSTNVVLNEAKELDARYVGIAWIKEGEGDFTDDHARKAAAEFNRIGQAAKAQGMQFFYHVHGYEFKPNADGTTPFDVLVAATDSQNVAYEMDVVWVSIPGQDPVALLKKYPNRWKLMHIKDMNENAPRNDYSGGGLGDNEVPVGQGALNFPAILQAAREIGVEKYYIEDETPTPLTGIPVSVSYLESLKFAPAQ